MTTTNAMHGVQRITYKNWSCEVFEGFYNTDIGDFTTVFESESTPPEGYEYDTHDWGEYQNAVGEEFTNLLEEQLKAWSKMDGSQSSNILSNLKFAGIYSPREYNFTTDKIQIGMDVDTDALRDYCFKTNRAKFDEYLAENFTSRDGFLSFIENNVHNFERTLEMEDEFDRYIQVMIEFYLLQEVDFELLRENLYENLMEIQFDYICLYNKEDGCQYEYSIKYEADRMEEVVVVGEKIDD